MQQITSVFRQFLSALRAGPDGAAWDTPEALALRESLFRRYPVTRDGAE
jgi:hypothetical protein